MTLPIIFRAQTQETPLTESVMLVVWRVQVSFAVSRFVYGKVATIPIAVRHESQARTSFRPVIDTQFVATALTVAGVLALGVLSRRRDRNDQRT